MINFTKTAMKKVFILIIFTAVLFPSCMSPEKKRCMKQIDSLKVFIDSSRIFYSKIDSAKIFAKFSIYKKEQEEAGLYSGNMKPADPRWEYLIPFANIEKPYRKALQRYMKMPDEISFSANQLKNLRQDYKNDLITQEKFKDFLQSESEAIQDMYMRIKFFNQDMNFFSDRIDTLNKHVLPLLDELKKTPVKRTSKKTNGQEEDD